MDYDLMDRGVIEYLVTCELNGTRFFMADNASDTATCVNSYARRYRDATDAHLAALRHRTEHAWRGQFKWEMCRYIPSTGAFLYASIPSSEINPY